MSLYASISAFVFITIFSHRERQAAIDIYASTHTHTQSNRYILLVLFLKQSISEIQSHKHILKVSFLFPSGTNTKSGYAIFPPLLVIPSFREALCIEKSTCERQGQGSRKSKGKGTEHNSSSRATTSTSNLLFISKQLPMLTVEDRQEGL